MIFNKELRFTFGMLCSLCQQSARSDVPSRKDSNSESSNDLYFLKKNSR